MTPCNTCRLRYVCGEQEEWECSHHNYMRQDPDNEVTAKAEMICGATGLPCIRCNPGGCNCHHET